MRLRFRDKTPSSRLEQRFLLYWQSLGGPVLEREYRFHSTRKWRADFAHVESRTLIEVDGAIYTAGGGRHNRAAGFLADLEKYLEAALAGWRVVRLAEPLITAPMVERLIAVRARRGCKVGVMLRLNLTPLEARISARRAWSGARVGDSHQDADFAFLGAYQSA